MTTTDWRALCAELLDEVAARPLLLDRELIDRARAALAEPVAEVVGLTDEELDAWITECADATRYGPLEHYWAFDVRFDHVRDIARAVLARFGHQPAPPAEGEVGELVAWLRTISKHFRLDQLGDEADRTDRAADLLEQHQPAPAPVTEPADEQLLATVDAVTVTLPPLPMDQADAHGRIEYDITWRIAMARAVLARWGGQAAPVPVAERLPGDQLCWWFEADEDCGYGSNWTLLRIRGSATGYTHWLPATALPLPAEDVQP